MDVSALTARNDRQVAAVARRTLGAILFDRPRLAWPLWVPLAGRRWEEFHNRNERLVPNPDGRGFDCDWKWASDLNLCRTIPAAGRRLLRLALSDWPVRLRPEPPSSWGTDPPVVSFVIGHSGTERLPQLLKTLESIAGQAGPAVECVVLEQDEIPRLASILPGWVRHIPLKVPEPGMPYCRSWAFNMGAQEARGEILVLHDNDVLVPRGYSLELQRLLREGFEAARLQRFVFYLDRETTRGVLESRLEVDRSVPELVRQNCQGHSIAISRDAYFHIGGHDEGFVGWGGEDNEFFDRLRTVKLHEAAYLPMVHLWHPAAPGKGLRHANFGYFESRMAMSREKRIRDLRDQCGRRGILR